ncbi:MAG: recombination-associated protein RdgC [Proteobacteria bacterium]|nr:recombination-associated protein RdgC [Pseudomonadota bacterium]
MGFLSASTSFTRYRIIGEIPETLWAEIPDRLKKNAFQDIDHTSDERSFGWVCFDEMLDSQWHTAPPEKGEFMAFVLRLDTRRISAAVMKKHYTLALNDELQRVEKEGKKFVSRDRKREIKDQTKLRLMSRSLPIPAVFDVIWNVRSNVVYLASTQAKLLSLFEDQFTLTFDLHLELQTPYYQALQLLGENRQHQLDDVEATLFV